MPKEEVSRKNKMVVVSMKIPEALLKDLDMLIEAGVYHSRSDAIRAAVRDMILRELGEDFLSKIAYRELNRRKGGAGEQSGGEV